MADDLARDPDHEYLPVGLPSSGWCFRCRAKVPVRWVRAVGSLDWCPIIQGSCLTCEGRVTLILRPTCDLEAG